MEKRKLGKNGPEITTIGLGTWAIGGPWVFGWGPQDDKESLSAILRALDLGINWIDTAPAYGLGHSEEIVGQALQGKRDRVILATKCGLVWDNSGKVVRNLKPDSIRREAEASLRRLKTDYIDLYQIHWPDKNTEAEESWEAMARLQEEGKVRFIGVSNYNVSLLQKCEKRHHVDSLQPGYSLLNRGVEKAELPWCRENGTGVVAYSPLQSGLLTGKFDKSRLAADDWRRKDNHFQEPRLSRNLEFADELQAIAAKYDKTAAQLAVAWVLNHPAVTAAIVGARRPSQIEETAGGADWQIDDTDLKKIDQLLGELDAEK
ncbi:MAG: aldo/keto reductase [Calditrichia bacterium]